MAVMHVIHIEQACHISCVSASKMWRQKLRVKTTRRETRAEQQQTHRTDLYNQNWNIPLAGTGVEHT